jgi:glycine cleavage system aminomethyltransferase T
VIDDLVVYRLADEHFLVVANAANAPTVAGEIAGRAGRFDADVDGFDVLLARTGYTGEDGFELVCAQRPCGGPVAVATDGHHRRRRLTLGPGMPRHIATRVGNGALRA